MFYILNRNIKTYNPKNMLDVGSGNGTNTIRVAEYFDIEMKNTYGVDSDDTLVNETKKIFISEKIDLEIEGLPFKDDTFNFAICNQVLEHLKNFRTVINEIIRVTSQGGYFVIGIPNPAHLINRFYLLFGYQPMCINLNGQHVRSFTHVAFIHLLHSIRDVRLIDYTGSLMYPLPSILSSFLSKYYVGLSGYTCYLLQKDQIKKHRHISKNPSIR